MLLYLWHLHDTSNNDILDNDVLQTQFLALLLFNPTIPHCTSQVQRETIFECDSVARQEQAIHYVLCMATLQYSHG